MRKNKESVAISIILAVVSFHTSFSYAQTESIVEEQAIHNVLKQYFDSMRERDGDAVRNVIHTSLTCVEAGSNSSRVEVVNADEIDSLLPPEGNDDWDNAAISDVRVDVSPTHSSAAMASFTITFDLREKELEMLKKTRGQEASELNEEQKKHLDRVIIDKSWKASMFALMAKNRGEWKIVSMTFPK